MSKRPTLLWENAKREKAREGYHIAYKRGRGENRWCYEVRFPDGTECASGAYLGTEQEFVEKYRKAIKRWNGMYCPGNGWSWKKTADQAQGKEVA